MHSCDLEQVNGHYMGYGAAVSEVEVDVLTGASRVLRSDILYDVGNTVWIFFVFFFFWVSEDFFF